MTVKCFTSNIATEKTILFKADVFKADVLHPYNLTENSYGEPGEFQI